MRIEVKTKANDEWTEAKGEGMISAMDAARAQIGRLEVSGTVECFFESPELYEALQNSRQDLVEHLRKIESFVAKELFNEACNEGIL